MIHTKHKSNVGETVAGYIISEAGTEFHTPKVLFEGGSREGLKRGIIIEANLQDADTVNRNKNIYEKAALDNGIQSDYVQERLRTWSWWGEYGHPLNPDVKRQLYLDEARKSHRVNKIRWNGNVLVGEVESALTTVGNDFKGEIQQGCQVAFSLRAIGPIVQKRKDGISIVKAPLLMFAYDKVTHPSHKVAYMSKVLQESGNLLEECGIDKPIFKLMNESEVLGFIQSESKKAQIASESMELKLSNMVLLEDLRTVCLVDRSGRNTTKACIYLEDGIVSQLNDHMLSLKNKFNL